MILLVEIVINLDKEISNLKHLTKYDKISYFFKLVFEMQERHFFVSGSSTLCLDLNFSMRPHQELNTTELGFFSCFEKDLHISNISILYQPYTIMYTVFCILMLKHIILHNYTTLFSSGPIYA